MTETAVNVPLDSNEVKNIICEELRKRLDGLGPLQGVKEYDSFEAVFTVSIRLRRVGEATGPKDTLAWGSVDRGNIDEPLSDSEFEEKLSLVNSTFKSGDPNEERQNRGMPLTVETKDGRGNVTRKKVTVKE